MVDNSPLGGPGGNSPIQRPELSAPKKAGAERSQDPQQGGPAFQALLDRLQQQARSLQHDGETLESPEQLPDAVDRAQASLEDALSLSNRLLEAYREATQHGQPNTEDDSKP